MIAPDYLGDAVYATEIDYGLMLTTDDHRRELAGNVIFFEPSTIAALERYIARMKAQYAPDAVAPATPHPSEIEGASK